MNLNEYFSKRVHFIGVGGVSMSGLARIMRSRGCLVSGSDRETSPTVESLISEGIPVSIGHDTALVRKADLVVFTAAIPADDPELVAARAEGKTVVTRAELLGALMGEYTCAVGVAGTHGKTTTTGLLSEIFMAAGLDPTIHVGGNIACCGGGSVRVGGHRYFISEACEYAGSFLSMRITAAVILNIDNDHLDYYKTIDGVQDAFARFAAKVPSDGLLVLNGDDPRARSLADGVAARVSVYSLSDPTADYFAANIASDEEGRHSFELVEKGGPSVCVHLGVVGRHNVANALAAAAVARFYGVDMSAVAEGLASFRGAARRFTPVGAFHGARVIHDYAHHPTEIAATIDAARQIRHNRLLCVFQPHTYSRLKNLFDDMTKALAGADTVLLTDVYAAREKNVYNVSSEDLCRALCKAGAVAEYVPDFDTAAARLAELVRPGDIILIMGAGNVNRLNTILCPGSNA
ncbi:MAG: UDP-N-acetylmuramate--L-alanine ligase [Eubacteriales bacterium]|nr:UDP-N-acetylmuramate--L-alanine ligase [Eubacteriales bacterium]